MTTQPDLQRCQDEPIHIPGSIQPRGFLIAVRMSDFEVVMASANTGPALAAEQVVGERLDQWLDSQSIKRLRKAIVVPGLPNSPVLLKFSSLGSVDTDIHIADGLLVLEIEANEVSSLPFQPTLRRMIGRLDVLQGTKSLREVLDMAVRETQALTGFDRVMIYRFDEKANGQVVAETISDDTMEPYLGLHFPASDIPAQARRLYIENPIRLIDDAAYDPVPLEPGLNPETGKPLDLSQAQLRSVSPIHCQYLANMGVRSSMSISLVHGDELWGLVACHHGEPWCPPPDIRMLAEFLAQVLTAKVTEMERLDALAKKNQAYSVQASLIDKMASAPRFQDGLMGEGPTLADLIECEGAAIQFKGELTTIGRTPDDDSIRRIAAAMANDGAEVSVTDHLVELYPPAEAFLDIAAGLVRVPLSADGTDVLLWFRGEQARSVTWAGKPGDIDNQKSDDFLKPRASFAAWVENVQGYSAAWQAWEVEVASDFRTALVAGVIHQAAELERLNSRLTEAGRDKDRMLATVSHELRNPLNAILGWVNIARADTDKKTHSRALRIIENNAQLQVDLIDDLLDIARIEENRLKIESEVLEFGVVVQQALETLKPLADSRSIELILELSDQGEIVVGDVRRLQQVIWNLVANSIKFSDDGRRIEVTVDRDESSVRLRVKDQGRGIEPDTLPTIFDAFCQGADPQRRAGLGLGLSIVKSIVELHGGAVSASSDGPGEGACFTVHIPVAPVIGGTEFELQDRGARLDKLRILVVEDQPDAAHMIATLLDSQGADASIAADGAEALERLREQPFDLVISDLDMPRVDGFELARNMKADEELSDIPTIALTAYTRGGDRAQALREGFLHHVAKPVHAEELFAVIASLMQRLD